MPNRQQAIILPMLTQFTDTYAALGGDKLIKKFHDIKGCLFVSFHYTDVIMTTMASQITSLTVVCSTVYSDADQRKHQSSASLAFVWGIHRDRWIPHTKGQLRRKCFHLMTSSCWWKTSIILKGVSVSFGISVLMSQRVNMHIYQPWEDNDNAFVYSHPL